MVVANGGSEVAECDVRRYFGGGKGAALGIWKEWPGRGRQGGSGVWFRERWASVCWDGDKWRPGGIIVLCGYTKVSKG